MHLLRAANAKHFTETGRETDLVGKRDAGGDKRNHRLRHPPIAWISHSSQMAENCGEDTNAPTNAIKQVVPISIVIGRRLIRHS